MKKTFLFYTNLVISMILIWAFTTHLMSQTPQYYNYAIVENTNYFPWSNLPGQHDQYLILSNEFNQPSVCPSGRAIHKLWFYTGNTSTNTLTTVTIKLGQSTITALPSGVYYTGQLDTVYHRASVTLSCTTGSWMGIVLDRDYAYDTSKSLIVDITQCGATSNLMYSCLHSLGGFRRNYGNFQSSCPFPYYGADGLLNDIGVDVVVVNPPPPATPPYWNSTAGTGLNTYPFGQVPGQRVNWLIRYGTLTQPTPAPSGTINAVYFWMGSTTTTTFTDLTVKLGQASLTTLPSSWYSGSMDTVYFRASVTLSSTTNGWMLIPLDKLEPYDSSKALIIDVQQCGATSGSMYVWQSSGSPATRNYGSPQQCPVNYVGQDGQIINFGVNILLPVGIHQTGNNVPSAYSLAQNYPNPFNPSTQISFSIPKSGLVVLKVYDILGREVATLVNENKQAGSYNVAFNASNYASGVYFYRIQSGDFIDTKKMSLIK
jgi:hypothetical protein